MHNRTKILASALLAAVFVAGAVSGGAVSSAWGSRNVATRRQPPHRAGYAEKLNAELTLTPEQIDHVEASLQRRQDATNAMWEELRPIIQPRLDSIRAEVRKEIAASLTDSQREKFYLMIARSDSIRRAERIADSVSRAKRVEEARGR